MERITLPIRVFKLLGVEVVICKPKQGLDEKPAIPDLKSQ